MHAAVNCLIYIVSRGEIARKEKMHAAVNCLIYIVSRGGKRRIRDNACRHIGAFTYIVHPLYVQSGEDRTR